MWQWFGYMLHTCSLYGPSFAHHLDRQRPLELFQEVWAGTARVLTETIKKLSCKDYFKGADCTTVELQQVSICQAVSAAFCFFLMLPQGRFLISTCVCFSHLFTASARALFQKQPCSRCSTAHQAASVWSESTLLNTINPVWCFQNLYNKKKRD